MGFLDSINGNGAEAGEGGNYVSGDEKDDIIAKSIPFTISAVDKRQSPFDTDKEQYVLTVQLAGEERLMTFNTGVASRDRSLQPLVEGDELAAGPVGPITLRQERSKNGRDVTLFASV